MDRYLNDKFKGIYRVKAHYDLDTNDYIRDSEGNIDSSYGDIYIDCQGGNEITHWGGKLLDGYVPSLGRGRNIVRKLEEMGKSDIIFAYTESDEEVLFKFHAKDIEIIAELMKVKTSGANINAFSVKNLPSSKPKWNKYEPQDKEKYNKMIALLKEWVLSRGIGLGKAYEKFYKEFGKYIKLDIVGLSKSELYKPVHIIDKYNQVDAAIEWLGG